MSITVAMIEEKEFKTKVRGYDPVEVDEFLDEICDEMVILQDEIASLQARLAQASRQQAYAAPMMPRPQAAVEDDGAKKLLERAQRMYDETIKDAEEEAARIIANAQAQVVDVEAQKLEGQRDMLQQQVNDLRAQTINYRNKLLQLMQEQREMLDKLSTL
ncbi:MAG: DivIVA domain-containing protein [Clostridia bacterium]|nr:DivIVA domain-containing protein [Clostridia bacterium]MBR6786741.1 DivIVA domain-containing protein [Clostridia bacterium]